MLFRDRARAGDELAERLRTVLSAADRTDLVILALPRGGVPVAHQVARELDAPLDVLVARKVGAPFNPELGVGAIAGEDPPVYDEQALAMLDLTPDRLAGTVAAERAELHRREQLYRGGRPELDTRGRTVVVVDDGLATGVTARAALRAVRQQSPTRSVLAVPVASASGMATVRPEVDEVVCLHQPPSFQAVGEWYEDFGQVSDTEVTEILRG